MLNQKDINSLGVGDKIDHFFLINKCELKTSKKNEEFFLIEFADKKSTIDSYIWKNNKNFLELKNLFNENKLSGQIAKVTGTVVDFNNSMIINLERFRLANKEDAVSIKEFMKISDRDIEEMKNEINKVINSINDPNLLALLKKIFTSENLHKFAEHPAGKHWHHCYIGGLIEHTLEMILICELICKFHPEINRDLLITGAILHDYGKIFEIDSNPGFEYTTEGKLLGHITISAMLVDKEIKTINTFPEELRINLLHLILSHQGKLENASPVVPKTLEAIVLYHADELSAKSNAFKITLQRELKTPTGWTKFINLAGGELYSHNIQKYSEPETLFD